MLTMSKRILIVDNSEIQCRALTRALQRLGVTTLAVETGADGLAAASLNAPDLIILDLLLPDMDGIKVCQQLKQDASTQRIPVILFTGRTRVVDVMRGFEAGADLFIGKGLSYDNLVHCVGALLANSGDDGAGVDHEWVLKTSQTFLESLWAAFDGVVRPRLEIALGTQAAAAVLKQAAEKSSMGWKLEALRQGVSHVTAVREVVGEFNAFVAEVFRLLEEKADTINVNPVKEAFEQQLILVE